MPRHHLRRQHPASVADPNTPDSPPPGSGPSQPPQMMPRPRLDHVPRQPQFQTPPTRAIPQLHPSSGPIDPGSNHTNERGVHPAAAAQAAIFSLFGRGVAGRPQGVMTTTAMMDDMSAYEEGDEDEEEFDAQQDDSQFEDQVDDPSGFGTDMGPDGGISDDDDGMVGNELEEIEDEEDEMMHDHERSPSPLPSNLREISSLASWTVSTHKPGCGVSALRNPSPTQYWQSDGPQPHTLTLHFFKLVAVVRIRVYLDFDMDESYTPTKMSFHAGMGGNDLVEFATWEGDAPCGWVDVPLEGVGGRNGGWVRDHHYNHHQRQSQRRQRRRRHGGGGGRSDENDNRNEEDDEEEEDYGDEGYGYGDDDDDDENADEDDPYAGSVLKAMVLQMRIMENHQNGKDTHVRGFQVFARDDDRRRLGNAPSASADGRVRRHSARKSLRGGVHDDVLEREGEFDRSKMAALEEPDWMGEPVIR